MTILSLIESPNIASSVNDTLDLLSKFWNKFGENIFIFKGMAGLTNIKSKTSNAQC